MKSVVLHIGLPKTGTTSIQNCMFAQRAKLLSEYKYQYGGWNANHSDMLSLLFHPAADQDPNLIARGMANCELRAAVRQQQANRFRKELKKAREAIFVLSAEKASSFTCKAISDLVDFLADSAASLNKVVCYVRDPVKYATSLAQQRMKTNATLDQIRRKPPLPMFRKKLEPWLDVLGKDILVVRVFEEAIAGPGGLLGDFLMAIGLTSDALEASEVDMQANQSMSMEMALLVDAVNKVRPLIQNGHVSPGRSPQDVNQLLRAIPGSPFTLGRETENRIQAESKDDVSWLETTFDIHLPSQSKRRLYPPEAKWSEETRRRLGLLLFRLFAENKHLHSANSVRA
jgi:hypothetical protein